MSSAGALSIPSPGYLSGTVVSIFCHLAVLAVALFWTSHEIPHHKGALPPVVSLQLGLYQLEKSPPQIVEGPKQVFSAPEPRQQSRQSEDPVADLPVVEQGTLAHRVKVRKKIELKKKDIQQDKADEPVSPAAETAQATSAYHAGEATASAANFTSAAQQAVSGKVGWENLLHTHLAKFKRYPRAALRYKATGISHVSMTLNAQGQVVHAVVITTSGNRILDGEALEIVKRAAPLPAPPAQELNRAGQVEVVAPISFYL